MRAGILRSASFVAKQLAQRGQPCLLQQADAASDPCPACGSPFVFGDERVKAYTTYVNTRQAPTWVHVCCVRAIIAASPWGHGELGP